ncbi:hypothetical protein GOBAR_AA11846 [Gossypium barbadense]|uniref:Uncharacterized protein n=1 Tax=Gossypium barbadense TaxID=3634 RepID=A0A2P5XZL8_GOSBA|nr:hypothetical protein GOBAR_AA11846 [Gossypium barbadense]
MLTKFISVSETRFQNTEATLKNQQASIQGLETQIGQLAKLISKRPQGSLPINTESNPREQLNTITIQDEEGLVEPEQKLRKHVRRAHMSLAQVRDKVLLDTADPRIATSEPNRVTPLTELATPLEKVLHDCHVLPDQYDNLFAGHCGCGTQPRPPPEYPPPILSLPWPIILHNSNSRSPFIIQEVSLLSLSYDLISISS